jgi:hypothetical protein
METVMLSDLSGSVTPSQSLAVAALAAGATAVDAAATAAVSERTVRRWLSEDENFGAALDAALFDATAPLRLGRDLLLEELLANIAGMIELRDDPDTPPAVRERVMVNMIDRTGLASYVEQAPDETVHITLNMSELL